MSRAPWLLLLASFACTAPPPTPLALGDPEVADPVPSSNPQPTIAQKLKLEISLKHGHAVIEVGHPVEIAAKIRNISREPLHIVLPGDGSAEAWREPHIKFTGTIDDGKGSVPLVPVTDRGRCGMFDTDWHDEIVEIPPGGEVSLGDWIPPASRYLAMNEPGRVTLTMHYAYTAGRDVQAFDPDAMGTTPAFELASNALQLQRARPLELMIRPRDLHYTGKIRKLQDYYQLEVWNNTDAPRELPVVIAAEMHLHAIAGRPEELYSYSRDEPGRRKRRTQPIPALPSVVTVAPDLADFNFPWKSEWTEHGVPGTFTLHLEGLSEPVTVNMDVVNHGYAR